MKKLNGTTNNTLKAQPLKTIEATSTSPEKQTDGKFITATTGCPDVKGGHNFNADGYEKEARRQYAQLPKSIQSLTTSMSFCHHTGTKLVIGTSFQNCKELTTLVKSQHPIFCEELPLRTAITIYGKARTATERYIAMTAVLVKARIINTKLCGLHLEAGQVEFLRESFEELLAVLSQALRIDFKLALDTLLVNGDIQSDHKRLIGHLKTTAQAVDSACYAAGGQRLVLIDAQTTKQLKLDDEIALEQELAKLLNSYESKKGSKGEYTPDLNRWTRRALNRSEMSDEQITTTMKILNTAPDNIPSGTIERIISVVEESLCYDDEASRRNSALVLRHLHHKVELQLNCLYKAGFIEELDDEEYSSDKAVTTYVTKTKADEDKAVQRITSNIKKDGTSALARLRKQHGIG